MSGRAVNVAASAVYGGGVAAVVAAVGAPGWGVVGFGLTAFVAALGL